MIEQINPQDNFNISINNNQLDSSALSVSIMNNEIISQLIEFGYSSLYSKRIFQYYHPRDIQEAVDYLSFEDGKIQHVFVPDRNNNENNTCYLCGEQKDNHLADQIDNSLSEDLKSSIRKSFLENRRKLKDSNGSIKKTNCPACEEDFIPNDKNTLKNCGHSFCDECWYDFLSIKIKENKLAFIKCMDYECSEKPDDDFIINLLNSNEELIDKYKRFKLELEIINDPNRKFCPFPNCNSFLELKDKNNKEVKCSNNHIFCFLCLKSPHGNLPCNNEINKSMVEYEKNNFLKKCPKCDIITDKITGCNHIICAKCNYQWCWLCNGEYDPEHFYEGKCRGLQFFRPKDENEIKLAQEGKIELRESQRQDDLDSENNDDEHFAVNNFNNSNLFNSFNIINIDRSENNISIVNNIGNNENNNIEQSIVNNIGNNENNNIEQNILNNIGNNENNNIEQSIVNNIGNNENNNIEQNNENNNIEQSIVNNIGNNENNNTEKKKENNNEENININQIINENNDYIKSKSSRMYKHTKQIISFLMKIRKKIVRIIRKIKKNNNRKNPIFKSSNPVNKGCTIPEIGNFNKNISSTQRTNYKFINNNNSLSQNSLSETQSTIYNMTTNIINQNNRENNGENLNANNDNSIIDINNPESENKKIKIKDKGKVSHDKAEDYNLPFSILIIIIYLIFGHFFIPINIYLKERNLKKSALIITSIILINIPFFFIQIFFNLILLAFFIKIRGYKSFLSDFYCNIKMEKKIININFITYNAYHILAVLFLATFWKIIKTFIKLSGNKNFIYIIGFIIGLIILPLHIIINPFLLIKAIKKNKENTENEFKPLKEYIYEIED